MNDPQLADHLDRAERALDRIERAAALVNAHGQREGRLREKVREVMAELDDMIASAGTR